MKKVNQHRIRGIIHLVSGLRVGGSDDLLQIGGTDLTCIKHPVTLRPYLPGSSLKGKMRSELERMLGRLNGAEPCGCAHPECPVCRIFGPYKRSRHELGPTRIIVRDAQLIEGGQLEVKTESTNKRDTGGSEFARKLERVAAGAKFQLDISIQELDIDAHFRYRTDLGSGAQEFTGGQALIEVVHECLDLLQDTGLGAGVGKGYGQIELQGLTIGTRRRRSTIQLLDPPQPAAAPVAEQPVADPAPAEPAATEPQPAAS